MYIVLAVVIVRPAAGQAVFFSASPAAMNSDS